MALQYVNDENGKTVSVILSIEEYSKIIAQLEEKEDIREANKFVYGDEELVEAEKVFKSVEHKWENE